MLPMGKLHSSLGHIKSQHVQFLLLFLLYFVVFLVEQKFEPFLRVLMLNPFLYRVIMVIGFLVFVSAVLYVVSKRIGLLKLQRKIASAIKSGSIGPEDVGAGGGLNHIRAHNAKVAGEGPVQANNAEIPLPHLNDEL